jgi:hypothetical protein
MWTRVAPIVLGLVVVGAGVLAFVRSGSSPPEPAPQAPKASESPRPQREVPPSPVEAPQTPPAQPQAPPQEGDLTWTPPPGWQTVPNASPMRLATYRVPASAGGDDAELTVARAGGTTDANIERWRGQFEGATGKTARTERTVHGLKVTVVELSGTYQAAGMMPGAAPAAPHPGWALLAAIVETSGSPYFFKMVGPGANVKAAHASFDVLIGSISPR